MPDGFADARTDSEVLEYTKEIGNKYGITISPPDSPQKNSNLTYGLRCEISLGLYSYGFYVSGFPGNCSSMVMSNIEALISGNAESRKRILEFAIALGRYFRYGALFISGTNQNVRDLLEKEYGFTTILDGVYNPHSGNKNYFAFYNLVEV